MYPEQVNNNYEGDGVLLYGLQGTSFYKETKENKVVKQYIDKAAVVAKIERIKKEECPTDTYEGRCKLFWFEQFLSFLDTLEVKEVDEEYNGKAMLHVLEKGVKQGRREILNNLWKPANGDVLPEIDMEVIVLYQQYPLENSEYAVSFAHRPNPNGWDGRNILTGEVNHYTPKTYDKGGWNIPGVKWWLDLDLPNMEE